MRNTKIVKLSITLLFFLLLFLFVNQNGTMQHSKIGAPFNETAAYKTHHNLLQKPVFCNKKVALDQAVCDFSKGFSYIQEKYHLSPADDDNWQEYQLYSQVETDDEVELIRKQCIDISAFFDIYENG